MKTFTIEFVETSELRRYDKSRVERFSANWVEEPVRGIMK